MKVLLALLLSFSSYASISEAQFYSIPKDILEIYEREIEDSGLTIGLEQDWDSKVVNAGANRKNNTAVIKLYGAHAKIAPMTIGTYALTVCHELGHLIGGLPKVMPTGKYSSEGQSDYFATNECLKRYLKNKVTSVTIPKFHSDLCLKRFNEKKDITMCNNIMKISIEQLEVDNFLVPRENYEDTLSLDNSISSITIFNDYPKVSCRYTTYINGALNKERPACWFNEQTILEEVTYTLDYIYPESMFIGEALDVQKNILGCSFKVKNIDYFREGQFESVWEDELVDARVYSYSKCPFKNGESVSGTVTEYMNKLYLNLNRTDK
jgi:hypothetical protein